MRSEITEMPYHLVQIQTTMYCLWAFGQANLCEPQFLHLYNGDNYSSNSGLLKAVIQANVYKALNATPSVRITQ